MVAVITGKGPGLETGSGSVLGSRGLLGSASTGRSGESVVLNAATGNLVITNMDEMLVGRGPDAAISRTYNSLGAWNGDNTDYWRAGVYRRVHTLSGTYSDAGTTVKRTDWDGSEITYTWNSSRSAYVATDGGGAYDTLTRVGTTWTWTDGDTQIAETYDGSYSGATWARIVDRKDADGNTVTYRYNGSGLIDRVTTGNDEHTDLVYGGTGGLQLQSLATYAGWPTPQVTRVFYVYDGYDRLSQVIVNLDPADNSSSSGTNYTTTYTYTDTVNNRVASIAQSDGTLVTVEYDPSTYRVTKITQKVSSGLTRQTTISYDTTDPNNGVTTITDNAGQVTLLTYDANNNLKKIVTPAVGAEAVPQVREFDYQADGDVLWIKDGPGNAISYVDGSDDYDSYGNRKFERDSAGNVIRRTYSTDGKNNLLTETRYLGPDPDGTGSNPATDARTTTYCYDSLNHLRYAVTPEGRVSEYRYDGFGQRVSAIDYTGSAYGGTLTEAALNTWVAGTATRSNAQRTDTWYDFRGNVTRTVTYAALDSYGEGTQDPQTIFAGANANIDAQADGTYRVTKVGGTNNTWSADAHSTAGAIGDFVLQVRVGSSATGYIAAVSAAQTSTTLAAIAHGIFFDTNGVAYYHNGTSQVALATTGASTYSGGETYWMVRNGTNLIFYKGNTLATAITLRTISSVTGTLYNQTLLYTNNTYADIAFTPQSIVNGANTSVVQQADGLDRITKTAGANSYDADARGSSAATGDFVLRLRAGQATADMMGGVSTNPGASSGSGDLNYGFGFSDSGALQYQEAGYYSSLGTSYAAGDNVWLTRVGTTIRYYKGATLEAAMAAGALRTVTGVTGTLYFDSALRVVGSKLDALFTPGSITSPAEISRTDYVYDPSGRLLSRAITGQGVETFVYDGLARITSSTDMAGVTTAVTFTDTTTSTTAVTLANGLTQLSTYNRAGELVSYAEMDGSTVLSSTSYGYDNLGRLRAATGPTGANYFFYDAIGRKVAEVDGDGSLTEYRYDANNNLTSSTAYATRLTSAQLAALAGTPLTIGNGTNVSIALQSDGLYRVTKTASGSAWNADAHSTSAIDGDFALQMKVGASNTALVAGVSTSPNTGGMAGVTLGIFFDSNGVCYLYPPGNVSLDPLAYTNYVGGDSFWMQRVGSTVSFYKGATLGAAMLAGAIRTVTSVSGTLYFGANVHYSGASVDIGFTPAAPTLDAIRPTTHADDRTARAIYDAIGRKVAEVDGDGSLTEYRYDGTNQLTGTTAYATKLTSTQLSALAAGTAPVAIVAGTNTSVVQQSDGLYRVTKTAGASAWDADGRSTVGMAGDFVLQVRPNQLNQAFIAGVSATPASSAGHSGINGFYFDFTNFASWDSGVSWLGAQSSGSSAWLVRTGTTLSYYYGTTLATAMLAGVLDTTTGVSGTMYFDSTLYTVGSSLDIGFTPAAPTLDAIRPTAHADDRVSRAFYDGDGLLVGTLDAEGYLTEIIYDGAGRKIRTIGYWNVTGSSGTFPSGITTAAQLRAAATTTLAQLRTSITASSTNDIRNQWLYDARGLVRATVDGEGTVTRFDYSPAGYLTQQLRGQKVTATSDYTRATLPAAGGTEIIEATAWTYNLLGQALTEVRTLTGSTTTTTAYTYDTMQRLVSTVTQSGTGDARTYNQRYDLQGRLTGELSGEGSAWLAANPTQVTAAYADYGWTYAYNPAGLLISKTGPDGTVSGAPVVKTLYYYNADGALVYEVNAAGEVAEYRYNAFGERTDIIVYGARVNTSGLTGGLNAAPLVALLPSSLGVTDSVETVAYNVDGAVKQSTDALGYVTTYTYNVFDELASSTEPLDDEGSGGTARNVVTEFAYDRRGLLKQEKILLGAGITTTYDYDAFGRAVKLTNALTKDTISTYDRKGRVTKVKDALNNETFYAYDARDNLVAVTDALGKITLFVYDKANRKIATIDALGGVTTTAYDADGRVIAERAYADTIDTSPLAALQAALLVSETTFATTLSGLVPDTAADHVTRYAYDTDGQLRFTVDGLRHVVEHFYDVSGNQIRTVAYDGVIAVDSGDTYSADYIAGRITIQSLAAAAGTRTTRAVYDATNRLTYSIDAIGQVTWFKYDTKGQLIRQVEFAATYTTSGDQIVSTLDSWQASSPVTALAASDRTARAYYDRKGQLVYSVDALGYVVGFEYDKLGNVKKQTAYASAYSGTLADDTPFATIASTLGTPTDRRITLFTYDTAGRLEKTTDPEGFVTYLVLDAMGQITSSTAAFGTTSPDQTSTTTYTYDDVGRVATETRAYGTSDVVTTAFVYNALGQMTQRTDANGTSDAAVSKWEYDALGRVTKAIRGHGTSEVAEALTGYDTFGRVRTATDARGSIIENSYDVTDQLLGQNEKLVETGGTPSADDRITAYTYDSFGDVVKVVDPRGSASFAYYDLLGRVTRQVDAERFVTDTRYTRGGQIASVTRRQVSPNQWSNVGDSTLWTASGATRTANGTIDGANATTIAVSTTATPGYVTAASGVAVTASNTLTFSFWIKKGSVDFASFGLSGSSSSWGSNGDSVAAIAVGPGTLTQTGGGLWTVSGLDATQETLITVTRTYQTTETATARIYAGSSTSSAVSGNSVVVARPIVSTDAVTGFAYNKRDEVVSTTDAMGVTESYTLNAFGERTQAVNKLGGITIYAYDKRGLLKTETVKDNTGTVTYFENGYSYDARGNRTQMVEAQGAAEASTTDYAYDKLDRLTGTSGNAVDIVNEDLSTSTSTPTETHSYDKRGNLVETVTAIGKASSGGAIIYARTWFQYDDLNRKTGQVDAFGYLTRFTYDANGNLTSTQTYETAISSPPGSFSVSGNYRETIFAYDLSNRLTETKVLGLTTGEWDGSNYVVIQGIVSGAPNTAAKIKTTIEYDKSGNAVRQQDPRGNWSYSWYDKLGRAVAQVDAENYLTVWERDAEGNVTRETRYDDPIDSGQSVATSTTLATLIGYITTDSTKDRVTEFTYDKNGRRTEEKRLGVVHTIVESDGTLTGGNINTSTGASTISYTYNGLGQVLTKTEANLADIAVSTTAREAVAYTYDAIGRLTLETGQSFTDYAGATVTPRTAYVYDGLNHLKSTRVQKGSSAADADDRITTYTYGAGGRLLGMTDANDNEKIRTGALSTGYLTRSYGYDLAGRSVRESYSRYKSDGSTSLTEAQVTRYDLAGRATTQTFARYTGSAWVFTDGFGGGTGNAYDAVRISYNAFGEISGRGLTAGPDATAAYQEQFYYDAGGRLWKSNTGDGVLRFHVYDKAGNETLTLVSTGADLSSLTASNYTASIDSAGDTSTSNAVTTLTVYNRRGQVTSTREPDRQLSSSSTGNTIIRAKTYNAFGEVTSETDARTYTTSFTYNTMGRILSKISPQVSVTGETGTITTTATPTETYGYDLAGRLVAVRDANTNSTNLNITRRLLLAGTGHGGSDPLVTKEFHPDTGVFQTRYDVFGDARILRNELYTGSNATATDEVQSFDKMGRLVSVQHRGNLLTDTYGYDRLGQRTTHYNSQLTSSVKETTDYDTKGRVTKVVQLGGDTTTYDYAWDGGLVTTGLATFGGWSKVTTNAAGKSMTESQDYFGRLVDKSDYGAVNYDFGYDRGGRLHTRVNGLGEDLTYEWYNTSLAASVVSNFTGDTYYGQTATSSYAYDASGNRTLEKYEASGRNTIWQGTPTTTTYSISHQTAVATYDALNRVTTIADTTSASGSAPMSIAYEYDAVGNIRRAKAEYRALDEQGAVVSAVLTQDNWYRYDSMNRFVVTQGTLSNSSGTLTGDAARGVGTISGKTVEYYLTGQRKSVTSQASNLTRTGFKFTPTGGGATRWFNTYEDVGGGTMVLATFTYSGQRRETYTYTDAGYLASVEVNSTKAVFHGMGNPNITYTAMSGSAGITRATYTNDAMGRVDLLQEYDAEGTTVIYERDATYNNKSQLETDKVTSIYGDKTEATTTYYYNASETSSGSGLWDGVTSGGTYMGGAVTRTSTVNEKNDVDSAASDTSMVYRLSWRDGTVQRKTTYDGDTSTGTNALWVSDFRYDASGNYVSVAIDDDRDRTVTFVTGADGLILQRDEQDLLSTGDPRELHYYFGGHRIGDTGNDGTSDVDYVQSIADHTVPNGAGPFRGGLSWGYNTPRADFDQSYDPINGLNYGSTASSYTVQTGDTLAMIAQNVWGDASLWYLLAEANGLTASSALSPGASLTIPNKVHNSHNNTSTWKPYDPNRAVGDVSPTAAKAPRTGGCGMFGQLLATMVALAVTIVVSMIPYVGPILAPYAANAAAQGVLIASGDQEKFNWKSLGTVAVTQILFGVNGPASSANPFVNAATQAAANLATQAVSSRLGLQGKIDWAGVAAAGVGSAAGGKGARFGAAASFTADAVASAATRSVLTGTSFGDNLIAVLPGVIARTIGAYSEREIAKREGMLNEFRELNSAPASAGSDEIIVTATGYEGDWLARSIGALRSSPMEEYGGTGGVSPPVSLAQALAENAPRAESAGQAMARARAARGAMSPADERKWMLSLGIDPDKLPKPQSGTRARVLGFGDIGGGSGGGGMTALSGVTYYALGSNTEDDVLPWLFKNNFFFADSNGVRPPITPELEDAFIARLTGAVGVEIPNDYQLRVGVVFFTSKSTDPVYGPFATKAANGLMAEIKRREETPAYKEARSEVAKADLFFGGIIAAWTAPLTVPALMEATPVGLTVGGLGLASTTNHVASASAPFTGLDKPLLDYVAGDGATTVLDIAALGTNLAYSGVNVVRVRWPGGAVERIPLPGDPDFIGPLKPSNWLPAAERAIPTWRGTGPIPGTFGVNAETVSTRGLQNFFPKRGNVEYIFDPDTSTLIVGNGKWTHSPLAASTNANTSRVVGGMFGRGPNGTMLTNEASGHFWRNWTPEVRQQFNQMMNNRGFDHLHHEGM